MKCVFILLLCGLVFNSGQSQTNTLPKPAKKSDSQYQK